MQLQYTANFRYGLRGHYRRTLRELECKKGIKWQEEKQSAGCSSLQSVFTVECREQQQQEIGRRLLVRVSVYTLEQCGENYPSEYINIARMLHADGI